MDFLRKYKNTFSIYMVTHKGWDFGDDRMDFYWPFFGTPINDLKKDPRLNLIKN